MENTLVIYKSPNHLIPLFLYNTENYLVNVNTHLFIKKVIEPLYLHNLNPLGPITPFSNALI
jgi:hypothetical protein